MKKVMLAACAAMVLVTTGASAGTLENGNSNNELAASLLSHSHMTTTVGTGFAVAGSSDGLAGMMNLSLVDDTNKVVWGLDGEASKNYYSTTAKISWINVAFADVYVGGGYLDAKSNKSCGAGQADTSGCALDQFANTTTFFTKKGGFGIAGLSKTFDFDEQIKVNADAGYRFGGVEGPIASVAISKKFGNEYWSKEFGLKVGYEQIKSDVENIDRVALYGTMSF